MEKYVNCGGNNLDLSLEPLFKAGRASHQLLGAGKIPVSRRGAFSFGSAARQTRRLYKVELRHPMRRIAALWNFEVVRLTSTEIIIVVLVLNFKGVTS